MLFQAASCCAVLAGVIRPGAASAVPARAEASGLTPALLRCEYLVNPVGLDERRPRLSWLIESAQRGGKQTAYQVLVASDRERLGKDRGDLWNSGKVRGSDTTGIVYAGKALKSRQRCFWKVRVWDQDGKASAWSEPASWSMGLVKPEDWKAEYISFQDKSPVHKLKEPLFLPAAQQYRKEFPAAGQVRRATIYSTALGIYELHLNGQRVGDAWFAPGWSDYHQRAYYNTFDVTSMVRQGANALGAWVADGWYSGYIGFGLLTGIGTEGIGRYTYGKTPALMVQLEIEFADGSRQVIVTDSSWKVSGKGPVQEADFLMGERYDARREMAGWASPGFDDSGWAWAILAQDNGSAAATFREFRNPGPGGKLKIEGRPVDLRFSRPPNLEAFPGLPVRMIEEIKPVAITSPTNGVHIFNLGQNFAGVVRLKVKGPAGTQVRLRYGEMLHPDGRLMTENLRKARATDFYVLRGDSDGEVYMPRFTFHGFQYVELTGYPGEPGLEAITGVVLHSDTPMASGFECSDPVVNRLFRNVVWTQRANFLDLPTDCPQRDERFGWTGDAQIYVGAATYNADVAAFYSKWLRELMESQRPSGTFPGYAPFPFQHGWDFGTAWCDAGVICPWTIWRAYGDTRIIERCWEPMTRFIAWRKAASKDFLGVAHGNEWGDWLSVNEKTPLEYIDTAYFAYSTGLMAEMAEAIGKKKQAAQYRDLVARIKAAFNRKYVKPDGSISVDTQTAYALALYMDLLPENLRTAAGARLAKKIEDNDGRMSTGFLGTRPLLPVLSATGQSDLAVRLLQSRKYPSWGYEVEQGATTIWERWNSYTKDKGFGGPQNAEMNSFAHYSFGAVCEWMFSRLAGIQTDGPGYKHIIIRPTVASPGSNPDRKPIDWVRAHYDSIHGRIASEWKLEGGRFSLNVTIPANTTATVYLPVGDASAITESGQDLARAPGLKLLRAEGGFVVLVAESGTYRFETKH
ncbi:MAG: glycoside hydrolase family 78 protein [Verrucomicrobiota bacterium]